MAYVSRHTYSLMFHVHTIPCAVLYQLTMYAHACIMCKCINGMHLIWEGGILRPNKPINSHLFTPFWPRTAHPPKFVPHPPCFLEYFSFCATIRPYWTIWISDSKSAKESASNGGIFIILHGVQFLKSTADFHIFCVFFFCNNEAILGNGNTIFGIRGKFHISSCPQSL